jgi:uncharacterized repeat protein (TIGR03803 family)
MKSRFASILLAVLSAIPPLGLSLAANAQTLTILYQFGTTAHDGKSPDASLTLVGSNMLYGTTSTGGTNGYGTVFVMNTGGSGYTNLHQFGATASDGISPAASLTLVGSTLYGTTGGGGTNGGGTVFAINADGSGYTLLHQFGATASDGINPVASLTPVGSRLYGTTQTDGTVGAGTVFAINTDGSGYAILHQFPGFMNFSYQTDDGISPEASLTLVGSTLYGTTYKGGTNGVGYGIVFAINTDGSGYTILHEFPATAGDGIYPKASLTVVGSTLYGTTSGGGTNNLGTVFVMNTDGSGYTILHDFPATAGDGFQPDASLTQVGSNTLYGTTGGGSPTVFAINTDGSGYTLLQQFVGYPGDGVYSVPSLMLVNSTLYSTTSEGGTNLYGTVFALTPPGSGGTNCTFSISSTNAVIAAEGGSNSVGVAASNGCAWNASTSSGFITITSGNGGSGDGTVGYTIAINSNTTARVGTLVIAGQTFTVTQASIPLITSIARTNGGGGGNNDILIKWNTNGTTNNHVQVTTGATNGSFSTNAFANLANIAVTTPTTNYLDVGGATNTTTRARYYRISSP